MNNVTENKEKEKIIEIFGREGSYSAHIKPGISHHELMMIHGFLLSLCSTVRRAIVIYQNPDEFKEIIQNETSFINNLGQQLYEEGK